MNSKNTVFCGVSLDGYISDRNDGLAWLDMIPVTDGSDLGYERYTGKTDALVMGRKTFEVVRGFEGDWPYTKPVFVLSKTLDEIPRRYHDKAELVFGTIPEILAQIHQKGYYHLYIDGGSTIQSFLAEDLVDEIITTTIPILLGGGSPLFADLPKELRFEHIETTVYMDQLVQSHYRRKR